MGRYLMSDADTSVRIMKVGKRDIPEALELCWKVFQEFEAPDYAQEGIDEFHRFIDGEWKRFGLKFYTAVHDGRIVGVLAMRPMNHISLFFVERQWQGKGIGRMLFESMKACTNATMYTVNAAPYAFGIYENLGFAPTDEEKTVKGIRFIPMTYCKDRNDIPCATCRLRAKYESNPKSLGGRFWRWHIKFCPGWKAYLASLPKEERIKLKEKYHLS